MDYIYRAKQTVFPRMGSVTPPFIHLEASGGNFSLRRSRQAILSLFVFMLLFPAALHSQAGSGATFLQLLQGAKQQATAGASTGALDDLYSIFINPAATGFLREWQWHATYAKWIAGVKNVSLLHGRRITTPWSDQTKLAFGVAYQGLQAFNSTEDPLLVTHANDLLFSASLGQPLPLESHQLSVGTNIKFLQSTLGNFNAQSWMADFGLLLRTPRFHLMGADNGFFNEGILSFGLALTHWGQALRFKNEKTPLPTTLRAGISFHSGMHDGLQLNVLADYRNVYGGEDAFGVGTEVSVKESFALRTGYHLDSDLLSHLSFGASISLDRNKSMLNDFMPQRNTALRLDFATTPGMEFFDNTFRGGVSYYPVDPESFSFTAPVFDAVLDTNVVQLQWQQTRDPDLFDAVGYRLLVAQDSSTVAHALRLALDNPEELLLPEDNARLLIDMPVAATSYTFHPTEEGDYFWAVLAFDKDEHVRPASCKNGVISRFFLAAPDIEITSFDFDYSHFVRNDGYQGKLRLEVTNNSSRLAKDFTLTVYAKSTSENLIEMIAKNQVTKQSSTLFTNLGRPPLVVLDDGLGFRRRSKQKNTDLLDSAQTTNADLLFVQHIAALPARGKKQIVLPWYAKTSGRYRIMASVKNRAAVFEINMQNNTRELEAFTIPKGKLQAADTAHVRLVMTYLFDLPFISEVYFDRNSARLGPEYFSEGPLNPSLRRLARRLQEHPGAVIRVRGFADPNSGEMRRDLADQRAANVKKTLIDFGVQKEQVKILPGKVLPRRRTPGNALDAKWLAQERRYVEISADTQSQRILFGATAHADSEIVEAPVTVVADINAAAPLMKSAVIFRTQGRADSVHANNAMKSYGVYGNFEWSPQKNSSTPVSGLLDRYATYSLSITDSLDRNFSTAPDSIYLDLYADAYDHKVIWPLRFGETSPMYGFYWERLYAFVDLLLKDESMRLRFIGHACAIGPEAFNLRLSERRARTFKKKFLQFVKATHPDAFRRIFLRLDESIGYGETRPLRVKHTFCDLDVQQTNHSPYERKLNRRIEIGFYRINKAKELFGAGFELTSEAR